MASEVLSGLPAGRLAQTAREGELDVIVASESDGGEWDAFVSRSHAATGYHRWAWRGVLERSFGHECFYLFARHAGHVVGVLPLVYMKSPWFGRAMTSLPFLNYGGVVADTDTAARQLVDAASELARKRRCRHIELRHVERRFEHLPSKQHKVSMRLPLSQGMWEGFDRKVRNQIRKAEKSQLTVSRGGPELLDDFYAVFARNMRDLGTPVYARRFFQEVMDAFPDSARLLVVRLNHTAVAAGLTYSSGTMTEVPWASSVRDYNNLCPNHLLYWHAIEAAIADGCDVFDFGRSTPNEGTYNFKAQWGATPTALSWEYVLLSNGDLPDQSPKNPKFRAAINTWRRLPLWLANALGPHIVRSIP